MDIIGSTDLPLVWLTFHVVSGHVIYERSGSSTAHQISVAPSGNLSFLGIPLYCECTHYLIFFQLWQLLLKLLNIIKCFLFYFRFICSWAAVFNMSFMTSSVIFWQNIFTMWNISVCCQAVIFIVIAELLPVMFNYCAPAYRWQVINSIKVI